MIVTFPTINDNTHATVGGLQIDSVIAKPGYIAMLECA